MRACVSVCPVEDENQTNVEKEKNSVVCVCVKDVRLFRMCVFCCFYIHPTECVMLLFNSLIFPCRSLPCCLDLECSSRSLERLWNQRASAHILHSLCVSVAKVVIVVNVVVVFFHSSLCTFGIHMEAIVGVAIPDMPARGTCVCVCVPVSCVNLSSAGQ